MVDMNSEVGWLDKLTRRRGLHCGSARLFSVGGCFLSTFRPAEHAWTRKVIVDWSNRSRTLFLPFHLTPFKSPPFHGNTSIRGERNSDGLGVASDSGRPSHRIPPTTPIPLPSSQSRRMSIEFGQPRASFVVPTVLSVRDYHIVISIIFNLKVWNLREIILSMNMVWPVNWITMMLPFGTLMVWVCWRELG